MIIYIICAENWQTKQIRPMYAYEDEKLAQRDVDIMNSQVANNSRYFYETSFLRKEVS